MKPDYKLIRKLCEIHAPSGNEGAMTSFLLTWIKNEMKNWKCKPVIHYGGEFQNAIVLIFGKPRTAVYAHIDNIGFITRYDNELIPVGHPRVETGYLLHTDPAYSKKTFRLVADQNKEHIRIDSKKKIEPGIDFSFECNFRETRTYLQSCYLDNRLGVYCALETARELEHGAVVFSGWEEHGGGSAAFISGFLYETYGITQALISDITWVTEGVKAGGGVAVSVRDSGIPRRVYVNRIRKILSENKIKYQVEVEKSGGSDGNEVQRSPWPIDWCFVGAPEELVHSPDEKVHKKDLVSMINAYHILMQNL